MTLGTSVLSNRRVGQTAAFLNKRRKFYNYILCILLLRLFPYQLNLCKLFARRCLSLRRFPNERKRDQLETNLVHGEWMGQMNSSFRSLVMTLSIIDNFFFLSFFLSSFLSLFLSLSLVQSEKNNHVALQVDTFSPCESLLPTFIPPSFNRGETERQNVKNSAWKWRISRSYKSSGRLEEAARFPLKGVPLFPRSRKSASGGRKFSSTNIFKFALVTSLEITTLLLSRFVHPRHQIDQVSIK